MGMLSGNKQHFLSGAVSCAPAKRSPWLAAQTRYGVGALAAAGASVVMISPGFEEIKAV